MESTPKYDLGTRVLTGMDPDEFRGQTVFVPATIIEQIGIMDIYDGRVPQEKVDFPVLQHFYWLRLEDGGETMNCESRIFLYPRNTDLSHLLSL